MPDVLQAFALGASAILTNACLLPLYPGLLAFLAGGATDERRRASGWLGALVLAGVLTMMLIIGLALYLVRASFGDVLTLLLPVTYGVIIVLGLLLISGRSPFARLSVSQAPLVSSPSVSAFLYGLLLGPMTLPCTGPILTSAFLLGAHDGGALIGQIAYFLAFGLGFGFPLVLIGLIAMPAQRRLVGWLTRNHRQLERASGVLLVAVGVFGILTELVPQVVGDFEITPSGWALYWALVAAIIALWWVVAERQTRQTGV